MYSNGTISSIESWKKGERQRAALLLPLLMAAVIVSAGFAPQAHASTPTLSLSATGSGDNVQINVTGDPNTGVLLDYPLSGSGPQIAVLGNTDSNGNYSTTISSASLNVIPGALVYVMTGGTSGPQSPSVVWPAVASASALTLSQTGVVISAGQSASITATNLGSNSLYVSNNSNPPIANVSISGSQITISGNTNGQTTVTLCQVGTSLSCPSVYVTVENSGASQLSFSQNSVTIAPGQQVPITVTGGSGVYTILNNSNSSVIQASLNTSVITLTTNSTSGASSITVCSTDMSSCGIINATAGSASSVGITFSNSAPTVSVGQNINLNIYGPSGSVFYISSNSSPSVAQVNVNGSVLTVTGIANGSAVVSVCSSAGTCGSFTATVNYTADGGSIALSQNTLSLTSGQTISISVSGGTAPYSVSGGSSAVAQESINGNILTVVGVASGISTVNVCSAAGACTTLAITVNGVTSGTSLSLSQSALSLAVGQSASVSIYGSGNYYLSNNTNPTVASVQVNASTVTLSGLSTGTTNIVVCQNATSCATLLVSVGGVTAGSSLTQSQIQAVLSLLESFGVTQSVINTVTAALNGQTISTAPSTSASGYVFTSFLTAGSTGAEVTALQQRLATLGYLTVTPTGYFGSLTQAAVEQFQAAHGISQVGYVGPSTRAALNQ